ncbi:unnamed protein product [Phaeothamnion confervicola]
MPPLDRDGTTPSTTYTALRSLSPSLSPGNCGGRRFSASDAAGLFASSRSPSAMSPRRGDRASNASEIGGSSSSCGDGGGGGGGEGEENHNSLKTVAQRIRVATKMNTSNLPPGRRVSKKDDKEATFQARVEREMLLYTSVQRQEEVDLDHKGRLQRLLCCNRKDDGTLQPERLRRRIEMATAAAVELEEDMAKMSKAAGEKKLFENASAESLNHLERKVFLKSRLLEDDEDPEPVPRWQSQLAWAFVVAYICGLAFYVCLFGAREGASTCDAWMIAFFLAFLQDVLIFAPLKLAFIYIFVPSLMRRRLSPNMFERIPRYAATIQVARRRPDLQVSRLILEGRIPQGHRYARYIPPVLTVGWGDCAVVALFTALAVLFALPEQAQGFVLDTTIAGSLGLATIGGGRVYARAPWGLAPLLLGLVVFMGIAVYRHNQQIKAEDAARLAQQATARDPEAGITNESATIGANEVSSPPLPPPSRGLLVDTDEQDPVAGRGRHHSTGSGVGGDAASGGANDGACGDTGGCGRSAGNDGGGGNGVGGNDGTKHCQEDSEDATAPPMGSGEGTAGADDKPGDRIDSIIRTEKDRALPPDCTFSSTELFPDTETSIFCPER